MSSSPIAPQKSALHGLDVASCGFEQADLEVMLAGYERPLSPAGIEQRADVQRVLNEIAAAKPKKAKATGAELRALRKVVRKKMAEREPESVSPLV